MPTKRNELDDEDILEIDCPKCKKKHHYLLDVERSYVVYNIISAQQTKPVRKSFTRIFVCPIEDQEFQVTFSLIQTFGTIIRNVAVKGVKDESKKEDNSEQE